MIEYKITPGYNLKAYDTFNLKYGDCIDAVIVSQAFLGRNGWRVEKIKVPNSSHFYGSILFRGKERKVVDFYV